MQTVDIDFDVFKALTALRSAEGETYNDVLRELLTLGPKPTAAGIAGGWNYKGINFPEGTEFKATYKGLAYFAKIDGGRFILLPDGQPMNSPSEAATTITGTSVNGWTFWDCKLPGLAKWQSMESLRR